VIVSAHRIDGLTFTPADDPADEQGLLALLQSRAEPHGDEVGRLRILRRSLDARKKGRPFFRYTLIVELGPDSLAILARRLEADGVSRLEPSTDPVVEAPLDLVDGAPAVHRTPPPSVAVVGSGPAGLFAALRLAVAGVPVTLLERGDPVEERAPRVARFRGGSVLDPESNIQFGEGGAGTFSDGKLYTGTRDGRRRQVLRTLAAFGAPADILHESRPHVGSDMLRAILPRMRARLAELGCRVRFRARVDGLDLASNPGGAVDARQVQGLVLADGERLPCRLAVLAIGHSARDSFRMLAGLGLQVRFKPFAAGFRVEHPQELIDRIQYGTSGRTVGLPAAEYRVAVKCRGGAGVYSFCMCPGGEVVAAASAAAQSVTNGMSLRARDNNWANSGLVTGIDLDLAGGDEPTDDPLAGLSWQESMEHAAWELGGGGGEAPAQRVTSFLDGRLDNDLPASSYRPGLRAARLDQCYTETVTARLREGLRLIDRRMRGFVTADALLIGVETRTSSPLRFLRDLRGQASGVDGLYVAGEGAGYAGGIISSAVDGLKIAESILHRQ
jgi:hypothetical protein